MINHAITSILMNKPRLKKLDSVETDFIQIDDCALNCMCPELSIQTTNNEQLDVRFCGNNLIYFDPAELYPFCNKNSECEKSGVTFKVQNDGTISVSGKADADITLELDKAYLRDCVVFDAPQIVSAGNIRKIYSNQDVHTFHNNVVSVQSSFKTSLTLTDGWARYTVSNGVGSQATTGDRIIVKLYNDNTDTSKTEYQVTDSQSGILLNDYKYAVCVYKTNIKTNGSENRQINFNLSTHCHDETTVDTFKNNQLKINPDFKSDAKIFFPQSGSADENEHVAVAEFSSKLKQLGDTTRAFAVYIPIYSTSTQTRQDEDYFDIKYIAFFRDTTNAFHFSEYVTYNKDNNSINLSIPKGTDFGEEYKIKPMISKNSGHTEYEQYYNGGKSTLSARGESSFRNTFRLRKEATNTIWVTTETEALPKLGITYPTIK